MNWKEFEKFFIMMRCYEKYEFIMKPNSQRTLVSAKDQAVKKMKSTIRIEKIDLYDFKVVFDSCKK